MVETEQYQIIYDAVNLYGDLLKERNEDGVASFNDALRRLFQEASSDDSLVSLMDRNSGNIDFQAAKSMGSKQAFKEFKKAYKDMGIYLNRDGLEKDLQKYIEIQIRKLEEQENNDFDSEKDQVDSPELSSGNQTIFDERKIKAPTFSDLKAARKERLRHRRWVKGSLALMALVGSTVVVGWQVNRSGALSMPDISPPTRGPATI